MSKDPFPERADTSKLFARNGSISAVLPLHRLARLTANLAGSDAEADTPVQVELQFGHDEEGRRRLQGQLQTQVTQLCQRCLQPMQQTLQCTLDLLVLDSEDELEALPDADDISTDAVVDEAGELDLLALIEDELLLSLPLAPLHEDPHCSTVLNTLRSRAQAEADAIEQRANPFAVLAGLKSGKDNI